MTVSSNSAFRVDRGCSSTQLTKKKGGLNYDLLGLTPSIVGDLDLVALRYALKLNNGADWLALTHVDRLADMGKIPGLHLVRLRWRWGGFGRAIRVGATRWPRGHWGDSFVRNGGRTPGGSGNTLSLSPVRMARSCWYAGVGSLDRKSRRIGPCRHHLLRSAFRSKVLSSGVTSMHHLFRRVVHFL